MSRESVLARSRSAAELGMRDACLIVRVTGLTTDDLGVVTDTTTTIYEGRCRFQQPPAIARPDVVGEAQVYQLPFQLQLPMAGSEGVESGDRVTATASVDDADLPGRSFWVKAPFHKTDASSRRVGLEEVVS